MIGLDWIAIGLDYDDNNNPIQSNPMICNEMQCQKAAMLGYAMCYYYTTLLYSSGNLLQSKIALETS